MSIWSRMLLVGNLIVLIALVSLIALVMWGPRRNRATLTPETVSDMISSTERKLTRDIRDALSLVSNEDRGRFSEEALRLAIRTGIEEALTDKASQLKGDITPATHRGPAAAALSPSSTGNNSSSAESGVSPAVPRKPAESGVSPTVPRKPAESDVSPAVPRKPDVLKLQEVHFSYNSADLTPGAQRKAHLAAQAIKNLKAQKIRVIGYADTVGDASYNAVLSVRRASAVADALIKVGIPRQKIEIIGRGETKLPERTGDEIDEPLNRCVGIFATN